MDISIILFFVFIIRFMHERLRTHAESVAFFGGGAREKEVFVFVGLGLGGGVGGVGTAFFTESIFDKLFT